MRAALQRPLQSAPTVRGIPYSTGILGRLIEQELDNNRTVRFPIDLDCAAGTKNYFRANVFLQDRFGEDGYEVSVETQLSAPAPGSTRIDKSYFIAVRRVVEHA